MANTTSGTATFDKTFSIDEIVEERLNQPVVKNLRTESIIYPKFHYEGKSKLSRLLYAINRRLKKLTKYLEKFYS